MARPMPSIVLLAALLIPLGTLSGQERGFHPEDYYSVVTVSQVAMAPSGEFVAFTVTTVREEENARHREIWLQPLTNGRPNGEAFRITDPTAESDSPAWSPDGSLLSFSSERGDDPIDDRPSVRGDLPEVRNSRR